MDLEWSAPEFHEEIRVTPNNAVFLAVHVPKCAGTSLDRHIIGHLPSGQGWITRKRSYWLQPWGRAYKRPTPSIIKDVRYVSGHHMGSSVASLFPGKTLYRSVLIREPTSFLLSYYNFRMMRYIADGKKPYSFELHLRSQPANMISHFILSRWCEIPWATLLTMSSEAKYERLNRELASFWYVADYSKCDELSGLISAKLDIPAIATRANTKENWLKRVDWQPLTASDLSPSTVREIKARTQIDRAIWRSWADVGLKTQTIQPVRQETSERVPFAITEAARIYHSAARRYQRGWF